MCKLVSMLMAMLMTSAPAAGSTCDTAQTPVEIPCVICQEEDCSGYDCWYDYDCGDPGCTDCNSGTDYTGGTNCNSSNNNTGGSSSGNSGSSSGGASTGTLDISAEAKAVFDSVNNYRRQAGLTELTYDTDLQAAANVRAQEIVKTFAHTRPDGSSWSTVSSKAKGENIASGYSTAEAVMSGWMNSQGHRENILRSSFKSIGVGVYSQGGTLYWVQLFGY